MAAVFAADAVTPAELAARHRAVMGSNAVTVTLDASGPVRQFRTGTRTTSSPVGGRLLAFRLEFGGGENVSAPLPSVALGIAVDGTYRRLPLNTATDAGGQLFVALLPITTHRVALVLRDAGVTQSLSLPDGSPASNNIAFLATGKSRFQAASGSGRTTARVRDHGSFTARLRVLLNEVDLYFFLTASGEIHPSSPTDEFIELGLCYSSADFAEPGQCHRFRSTDVTVTPAGHQPVRGRAVNIDGRPAAVFEVPAAMTRGSVTVSGSESSTDGTFAMTITRPLRIPFRLTG